MAFYWQLLESNKCFTAQPILWGNSCNTWKKNMYWKEKKGAETIQSQIRAYIFSKETVSFCLFLFKRKSFIFRDLKPQLK